MLRAECQHFHQKIQNPPLRADNPTKLHETHNPMAQRPDTGSNDYFTS